MNVQVYKPASAFRLITVMLVLLSVTFVLVWRAVDLHVVRKAFLQDQGDARYLRELPLAAHRGMITDRHGEPLAISTPVDSVWVNPAEFAVAQPQWPKLAKLLNLDVRDMVTSIAQRQDKEFVYIKRHVEPARAERVMDLGIPGVSLQREYQRYYPMAEVVSHVVGFTDIDDQGQEGLELAFDKWLSGEAGSQRVIRDRLGRVVKHVELLKKPRPGQDLALSIDRRLQYLAYRELKRAVIGSGAKSGSAVILDVKTGEVLAMVNQPAYNPNNRGNLQSQKVRNRAVTDVFEPGSTIKPFTVVAALQSGNYNPDSLIDTAPGYYQVSGNTIRDVRNYGRINLTRIIQKSSNVGASKLALSLEPKKIWRVFDQLGFGMVTSSGFPGEAGGVLKPAATWGDIEQATLAFGYGLAVTPLQLTRAYAAIANQGVIKPVSFVRVNEPVQGKRIIDAKVARNMVNMLETVTNEGGTGTRARVPGYRVAGKTGTVKKVMSDGYTAEKYIAVFAGMAPASNPRIAMVVTIDEPSGEDYYGGQVAAPVFSRVMGGALRLFDIAPDNLVNDNIKFASLRDKAAGEHP
ncbi:peptidoglycan D,D-transpeptidase FtsI family protein [Thiohalophilus sp.]|uniref:peptidoglycan D,D-transpeptidase FtsI family protein n=1 Tax=Thiohalophilus sp. TaxID=3028392 RepID=UPI002ACE15FB|nr:penicillin-binding transpeptidase domain-containing protein [Thiohalophilus sp.]MDZ7662308.1 penicillin-binding transpeptidase domain-containing protein [Thiohalophilus sp.]